MEKNNKDREDLVLRKKFADNEEDYGEVSGEIVLRALCKKIQLDNGETPEEEGEDLSIAQKRTINRIFKEYVCGEYIPYPEVDKK